MLVSECVNVLSGKLRASLFWLETAMGQEFSFAASDRAERKGGSMSVAWIWMLGEGLLDVRSSRLTVPEPQALSWMMEPEGMGAKLEML